MAHNAGRYHFLVRSDKPNRGINESWAEGMLDIVDESTLLVRGAKEGSREKARSVDAAVRARLFTHKVLN